MAKTNKTDFAILGILNIEPMSGYDIRGFIQQSIGYFWQESYGQIYPALRRLHARKWVSKRKSRQSRGPERFVYSLTAPGRTALESWLAAPAEPETVRVELLLKLFFGTAGKRADQIRQIESLLSGQRQRLELFDHIESSELPPHSSDPNYPYWRTTVRYGLHITRARVAWCEETLAWLRERPSAASRDIRSTGSATRKEQSS